MTADNPGSAFLRMSCPPWSFATALTRLRPRPWPAVLRLPFQPREPLRDAVKIRLRNSWTVIDHLHASQVSRSRARHSYDRVFGSVPLRILEQVDDGLRQEFAISLRSQTRLDCPDERAPPVFEGRRIALSHLREHFGKINWNEEALGFAAFHLRDAKDCCE